MQVISVYHSAPSWAFSGGSGRLETVALDFYALVQYHTMLTSIRVPCLKSLRLYGTINRTWIQFVL